MDGPRRTGSAATTGRPRLGAASPARSRDAGQPTPPSENREIAPVSDRERALAKQIKTLNNQVLALRRQLALTTAQLQALEESAAKPPPRAAAPQSEPIRQAAVSEANRQSHKEAEQAKTHTVRRGETLSSLARTYYGSLKYWPALRDANRDLLKGNDVLRPGMVLHIPPLEELVE